jgi:hypothetical protein
MDGPHGNSRNKIWVVPLSISPSLSILSVKQVLVSIYFLVTKKKDDPSMMAI